jgi:hypothetical protein
LRTQSFRFAAKAITSRKGTESMSVPERPVCPGCEAPMEQGFVVTMSGLHWASDEKVGRIFAPNTKTDTMYPGNEGAFLQNPRYFAARCRKCGLALLAYRE